MEREYALPTDASEGARQRYWRFTDWEKTTYYFIVEDDFKVTDNLSLVFCLSYDINKPKYANGGELRDDETAYNPQAGIRYTFFKDTKVFFSVGRKTRFPTMFQLYSEQFGRTQANPNLKEEKSVNYEAGIEQPLPWDTVLGLNLFQSDVKDLIVKKEVDSILGTEQNQNIGKARYRGCEFIATSTFLKDNVFELNYTFLDADDKSSDRTSDRLEETVRHKLYVSDHYTLNEYLSFFTKLEWNSKRYYEDSNTNRWESLHGFWTIDAKVIGTITQNLDIEAGARNTFADRSLDDITSIEVLDLRPKMSAKKAKKFHSSEFSITGKSGDILTFKELPPFPKKKMIVKHIGEGKGYHGILGKNNFR